MIYLDNNSTTPVDPRVLDTMLPYFSESYGNAASTTHEQGREARKAVERAREILAHSIGAASDEIYFTSGATESNNLAIRGACTHRSLKERLLLTSLREHRAVLDPFRRLAKEGFELLFQEDTPALLPTERPVALASFMLANNEIGEIRDLSSIREKLPNQTALFHSDVAQAMGRVRWDVVSSGLDLASLSAHKIYGPKGIGALYVRRGTRLKAIIDGGGHESGKRSGTLNVPGIVGFGKAVELGMEFLESEVPRLQKLMQLCDRWLHEKVGGCQLNGPEIDRRLPGNLNYRIEGIDAEALTLNLPEICISTGSACTSADPQPSHVLRAIGLNESEARSSIRIGIGRFNTEEEIRAAVDGIAACCRQLRNS